MTYFNIAMKEFEDQMTELMNRTPKNYPDYADPLKYNPMQNTVEEWNEVPEIAAQNFLHMQHHH